MRSLLRTGWISRRLRPLAAACRALPLVLPCAASAGATPGITAFDQVRDITASVGSDLDGDGVIRDLAPGEPGDEARFSTFVQTLPGGVPPSESIALSLGGAAGEAGDTTVVTLSADGTTLTMESRGHCRAATQGLSYGQGKVSHDLQLSLGGPVTVHLTGTLEGSEAFADDPNDSLAVGVWVDASGGNDFRFSNDGDFPGSVPLDATRGLPGGFFELTAFCAANTFADPAHAPREASWDLVLTVTLGGPDDACLGDVLTWAGGRTGAFAEPDSWSPPKVPVFVEGGACDTAIVQGGRNVTIDLAGAALARAADPLAAALYPRGGVVRRAGRLVVRDSQGLRPVGGRLELDALSPDLGARSLEVGDDSQLLVAGGALAARHVALGVGGGAGELEVVGPAGRFETTGRFAVGASGDGSLLLRQGGQVTSAESLLGEVEGGGAGRAVVQDAGTVWSAANLAVGHESDGSLEVLGGARVESDQSFVDFLLDGGESASATVGGRDAQGNRATWSAQSLQVGRRGGVHVDDGGFLDIAENLLLAFGDDGAEEQSFLAVRRGGQLAASSANVGGTLILSPDSLALIPQTVQVGDAGRPATSGLLLVQGPATGPQLDGPTDLEVEAHGAAVLLNGARANLFGPFVVGLDPDSDAFLRVSAGQTGTGEASVLRATATDPLFSVVGKTSDEPAGVLVRPTGRLVLEGGRIELLGSGHSLRIGRGGLLTGRGGTISIEPPGTLANHGVIEGGFTLDGSYEQAPGAMVFGQILSPAGTPLNRVARGPFDAADIPRSALRKKPAPAAFGPFVVTGDAALDGRLTLQFGNGVAPRTGESFEVLDVGGTVTGEFAEVAIQGLVPGSFAFEPSLAGGKLALVSTKDAVALPAVSVKAKARLQETAKKGGKIKLKRTGDTSAPLLVTYSVGGTAQPGVDYEALPGAIEIPAKKKGATILVRPIADGTLEGPETIELELVPNESFAPGLVPGATIELLSKDE